MFHNSQAVLALSKEAEPHDLPEDARAQRLLLQRRRRLRVSAGQHPDGRQVAGADVPRREAAARPGSRPTWSAARRSPATPSTSGSPPRTCRCPENRVTLDRRRQHPDRATRQQRGAQGAPVPPAQGHAQRPRHAPRAPAPAPRLPQERDPRRRLRAPGRHLPVRHRPRDLGARRRLPRARARQPVRRRHELLPEHRRGQPRADGDGKRPARRRPPARAHGRPVGRRPERRRRRHELRRRHASRRDRRWRLRRSRLCPASWRSTITCIPRCSTRTTTTSSNRCSTRWRPRSWRRATSRTRCGPCSPTSTTWTSSSPRSPPWTRRPRPCAPPTERNGPRMRWSWPPAPNRTSSHTPGAAEHSFPLYSLDNATDLRSRILGLFEQVDRDPKLVERGALNFVIVGGGPTGVEVAGALADMLAVTVPAEYQDIDMRCGAHLPARLRRRAAQALLRQGPRLRRQGADGAQGRAPAGHRRQGDRARPRKVLGRGGHGHPLRHLGRWHHRGRRSPPNAASPRGAAGGSTCSPT